MSYSSELNSYIARVHQRLRLGAWLRGAAVFAATALVVTVALVFVLNRLAFPHAGVSAGRIALLLALGAAALLGLAVPLARITRDWAVRRAERANPDLEHRLTTFAERNDKAADPFLELLAADTLARTQEAEPSRLLPDKSLFALGGAGLACLAVLLWMIAAGPGYVGYGASLLWTGAKKGAAPLYDLSVTPGNITVRRNSDQLITARLKGMQPEKAQVFAKYASASGWEPASMQLVPGSPSGSAYQFVFAGLPENVEYYVTAGPLVSSHYRIRVVDLPSVKDIRVIYKYPAWTGLKTVTEEHSGDLRAIEGTQAQIELQMDRPLKDGLLSLDGGQTIQLAGGANNLYRAIVPMEKDGSYHVSATDDGQAVRLSEDYFIATDKAAPPEVALSRPGADYRASPIEEVTLGVKGSDEFGLRDLHLHYSVNGGADRDMNLLKTPGAKSAEGSYTLPLEDFKLKPGDLVSVYATAKDGHSEARTDISFIQVDPFEREFSQSQQSGGGGGGGGGGNNNQTEISKREKELIAATWKQQNDKTATPKDAAAQGEFLSEAQRKLRDQVNALSLRMQSRDINQANSEFTDFDKDMQDAAAAMAPSADKLKGMQWKDAIPLEQKALQALLRAEATFRKIEVAFGQTGGGGGGGGNAGRDLASLFDLELDTEKNQYETAQSVSPEQKREKDLDDALQKLDALAKRQEDLANQQHNPQQTFEQRWQQEMLRREAEQLQHDLEQMAQNNQKSGQSSAQSGSQSASAQGSSNSSAQPSASSASQSGGSSSNTPSTTDQRIQQALSRLRQATGAMRRGDNSPGQQADAARQASESLREAQSLMAGSQQQMASGKMGALAREADRLRQEERSQADKINRLANAQTDQVNPNDLDSLLGKRRERDQLAGQRQQLSDGLSALQQNLREAARGMAAHQPGAAQKLRDALSAMDDADLENRVQRSADWLRRGINPNANGTESEIARGLDKLIGDLQQAQAAMGREKPGAPGANPGDQNALLNQVERLRQQIEAASRAQAGQPGAGGDRPNDRSGPQSWTTSGQLARNGQPGANPQAQQPGTPGSARSRQGARAGNAAPSGDLGNQARSGGQVRDGAAGADGTAWNNINTGNNRYGQSGRPGVAPTDASGNPADSEASYEQEMRQLSRLRQQLQGDPQTAKEVADLTRQMQNLDPKRFPGNPAIVDQMNREILSSVDRLELALQRAGALPEARATKPSVVPLGYQDAVADYYKRLSSKNPQQ
ncbi:DUF4175 family protein [Acidobacteria bacterium AB60]|nr:DUF4175 family protein [Acidobacteria bacterium AB60]